MGEGEDACVSTPIEHGTSGCAGDVEKVGVVELKDGRGIGGRVAVECSCDCIWDGWGVCPCDGEECVVCGGEMDIEVDDVVPVGRAYC